MYSSGGVPQMRFLANYYPQGQPIATLPGSNSGLPGKYPFQMKKARKYRAFELYGLRLSYHVFIRFHGRTSTNQVAITIGVVDPSDRWPEFMRCHIR